MFVLVTIFNNDESAHSPTLLKTEFTTDALIGQVDNFRNFRKERAMKYAHRSTECKDLRFQFV